MNTSRLFNLSDEEEYRTILQNELDEDEIVERMIQELMSSSDEEEEEGKWGGSREGRAPNKLRDFAGAYAKIVKDYFSGRESVYDEKDFERRFRMPRRVFFTIHDRLMGKDPFVQKKDAT
jgi:hypothetical protein